MFLKYLGPCDTAESYCGEEDAKHHFAMSMIEIWPVDMVKSQQPNSKPK